VPYNPETAKGVSPNPKGGGDPKKHSLRDGYPNTEKPKSIALSYCKLSKGKQQVS
jgi:hypothetical protein